MQYTQHSCRGFNYKQVENCSSHCLDSFTSHSQRYPLQCSSRSQWSLRSKYISTSMLKTRMQHRSRVYMRQQHTRPLSRPLQNTVALSPAGTDYQVRSNTARPIALQSNSPPMPTPWPLLRPCRALLQARNHPPTTFQSGVRAAATPQTTQSIKITRRTRPAGTSPQGGTSPERCARQTCGRASRCARASPTPRPRTQ